MRRFTTFLCTCLSLGSLLATEPAFHKVDVKDGEGVYSLLRRYGLQDQASVDKFYEINKLSSNENLILGREYYLPILVYQYDGVSIRSTIGINDWDLAVRIAEFNRTLQRNGLRNGSYEESKVLLVPYYELRKDGTTLVTKAEESDRKPTMRIPLFGEGHDEVTINSQELKGKVFYVVSGHGGPDPGAMAEAGGHTLCEDEYAYDVSIRLAKNLMERGAIVEMIVQDPNDGIRSSRYLRCDKDEVTADKQPMPVNQLQRLKQRVNVVNQMHQKYLDEGFRDQTVICIHVDSRGPSARQDVFFYYYEESKAGKKLAYAMQDTFRKKYEQSRSGRGYSGTVSCRSLYELKHTDPKAVYVELANIQNAGDLRRLLPEDNRQALANWLCDGLIAGL